MKIRLKNKQHKKDLQLRFVQIGWFSSNLWNRYVDLFLNVYFLFQNFMFNKVWIQQLISASVKTGI